jgi:DNA-binding CsgD family transcriptional regulator
MEEPVQAATNTDGFILINEALSPVAFNAAAVQILAYPTDPDKIHQPALFIRDKIRFWLVKTNGGADPDFVREFSSGRRTYHCRAFRCDCQVCKGEPVSIAVLLERPTHGANGMTGLLEQFGLTPREMQTVVLVVEGLTSKEIAARMKISPNTVKAFLRIIMFKMDVSTRSGIVGKVLGSIPESAPGGP